MILHSNLLKRQQKKISELLTTKFLILYYYWRECLYDLYVCKGGRGSAKSSNIAIILVLTIILEPVNALCIRKVGDKLEKSVFEQIRWAIKHIGVEDYFIIKKSPMEIIYKERGNKFIFSGLDDPEKLKSIKTADFPIAVYWVEELAEHKEEKDIEMLINSILRGELPEIEIETLDGRKIKKKLKYRGIFSYNPPKSKLSWVNKKYSFTTVEANTYVHTSTYLDNPYISEEFKRNAENCRKTNLIKYRHQYLGEPVGNGLIPFPNLEIREIKEEELQMLDTFKNGLDWGYGADPLAFVRWAWDRKKRIIYATDEYYGLQISNRKIAEYIVSKNYDEVVTCDNAEPKSIDELIDNDVVAWAARKGKGSVEYGEKWLADLTKIVIDPARTPNIAKEFETIDYAVDRNGNPMNRLEDKGNHTIDATRYAFEEDMRSDKLVYDV